jgi:amyloid beta precursor protein binding protein 1
MNNAKYDRQLRLWNGHGQQKLEEANILALGSGIEVAETLKNLVLPGLGGYVLVDDTVVSLGDLGNNFYLQPQDIGRHRALAVSAMINELNSVNGMSVVQSISEYIKSNDLSKYTLIVAADLLPEEVAFLKTFGIPLVCVWVNGFFGFMHLSINIHTVIETHPSTVFDYRFDSPWPELQEYRDSINLDSLSEMDYIHVPFPVFILKAMDSLNFAGPLDYEQQKKVKDMIKKMDLYQDNENIQEALKNVPRINSNVPFHILEILNHPMALTLDSSVSYRLTKSSDFWILVNSLGRYVSKYQQHPLTGILPDMKSDTEKFVNLTKLSCKSNLDTKPRRKLIFETLLVLLQKQYNY